MTKFQIYQDRKGEYRWRLRARNGEIIADGNEGYKSKTSCKHGIDLVKSKRKAPRSRTKQQAKGRQIEQRKKAC